MLISKSEKIFIGFSIFIVVVLIVVAIVMLLKKNDDNVCSGDSQYNCGVYKNKKDCNEAGPSDVPGGCKWGPPSPQPSPQPSPACNVSGGNGSCKSGINTQGKRNCVGGDQLCGVNLAAHQQAHPEDKNCSDILTNYGEKMIKCNDKYQAFVDKEQGNCVFKCRKSKSPACCGITSESDSSCALNSKEDCDQETGKCKWQPNGC